MQTSIKLPPGVLQNLTNLERPVIKIHACIFGDRRDRERRNTAGRGRRRWWRTEEKHSSSLFVVVLEKSFIRRNENLEFRKEIWFVNRRCRVAAERRICSKLVDFCFTLSFLVADTRLYTLPCRSVGLSVCLSVTFLKLWLFEVS